VIAPLLFFVKPRVLASSEHSNLRSFELSFLWDRTTCIFQLGNIIQGIGFFLPTIYLPTYARELGANGVFASLPVTLFNLGSIFGFIVMGWIVDRTHATTCILLSTVGSTLSVFLIWGFSLSLPPLYVFSITYGVFAGSYATTWPAVIGEIRKKKELADPGTIFAYLQAGRGIGSIISGPLSEALVRYNFGGSTGWAYGSSYGPIIIFTGITAFLGGLGVVA
jgi:MFS family permease